jgi:threonine/homoserine/homoserine lactone efflux protein
VCGTAVQCTISLVGLGLILTKLGWFFTVLRYCGAAYLIYLGVAMVLTEAAPIGDAPLKGGRSLFAEAFLVTLGNPKAIFFFSAMFPQFIAGETLTFARASGMLATVLAVTFVCMMLYAAAGQRIRTALANRRILRRFNYAAGTIFVGLGVGLALERK